MCNWKGFKKNTCKYLYNKSGDLFQLYVYWKEINVWVKLKSKYKCSISHSARNLHKT